jgi:hypothetical protein
MLNFTHWAHILFLIALGYKKNNFFFWNFVIAILSIIDVTNFVVLGNILFQSKMEIQWELDPVANMAGLEY